VFPAFVFIKAICEKSESTSTKLLTINGSNINHLDNNRIQWFVGFIDGEGNFNISLVPGS
jgi:hypothetical protein